MRYVASCSYGKDSLAMVLYLINNDMPLDEVVYYDTGVEFNAIYRNRDKLVPVLQARGIKYVGLEPERPFLHDMLERPVQSRQKGKHNGYGWCGGLCRWGTTAKLKSIERYLQSIDDDIVEYVGIAADEAHRRKNKTYPLIDWGMTEADCLAYCRENGWGWREETPVTESGYIDLYDILDRVSCWCCCNNNRRELYNIWRYLPQYWEQLKKIQSQLDRPMKNWKNKKYGAYGNVYAMEKVFEMEGGTENAGQNYT